MTPRPSAKPGRPAPGPATPSPPGSVGQTAGDAASEWAASRERGHRIALQLMAWIATTLGRRVARWLLHPIALYFLCFAPQARRHSARFLARARGRPARLRERYRHIHTFASVVLDRVYFARDQMALFDLPVTGGPLVDAELATGRGCFLLGAHFGSFEALHAIGATRPGMRVAMVMYPDNARMIQSVLQAIAPAFRLHVIPIGRPGSTLAIRDWLDGGGLAGLLGDRYLPGDAAGGQPVQRLFLGQPALFVDGPLRLAQVLRRRVLFMAGIYRGGNRYELRFESLADFTQPADAAAREQALQQAMDAYVARLEALCREAPENWFNFYDFWHEDAPAAPSPGPAA
jgi:predicted LPLAT superfamily acyltransferase